MSDQLQMQTSDRPAPDLVGKATIAADRLVAMRAAGDALLGIPANADAATAAKFAQAAFAGSQQAARVGEIRTVGDTSLQTCRVSTGPANPATGEQPTVNVTVRTRSPQGQAASINLQRDEALAESLLNIDVATLGIAEERAAARIRDRLEQHLGYDPRSGEKIHFLQGKARADAEMQLWQLEKSHRLAQVTASVASRVQAEHRAQLAQEAAELEAAVQHRAQELIREDEVERLAKGRVLQLKAKAGRYAANGRT